MLTKEEVTEIVLHCQSEHITYTQRLKELGIPEWKYYALEKMDVIHPPQTVISVHPKQ